MGKNTRKIGWLKEKPEPEVANARLYDLPEMTEAAIPVLPNCIANCTEQYRDFLRFLIFFYRAKKN